jgi:hypothetical protein
VVTNTARVATGLSRTGPFDGLFNLRLGSLEAGPVLSFADDW